MPFMTDKALKELGISLDDMPTPDEDLEVHREGAEEGGSDEESSQSREMLSVCSAGC